MTHPNADRLRTAYRALAAGDLDTVDQLWTDDIVWHVHGVEGPMPGEYEGKPAVFELLGSMPRLTDRFDLHVHDVVANDEHAVGLMEVTIERRGRTHRANAVHVYHVTEDGRFDESWHALVDNQTFAEGFWRD